MAEQDQQLLAEQLRSNWRQRKAWELQGLWKLNQRQQQKQDQICCLLCSKEAERCELQEKLQQQHAAARQAWSLQQQLGKELAGGAWSSGKARAELQDVLSKAALGEQ